MTPASPDPTVALRPISGPVAEWLVAGGRPSAGGPDLLWHPEFPSEEDRAACGGLADRATAGIHREPFGHYFVLAAAPGAAPMVVGGVGFHGPPLAGVVEVGYGVVAPWRGRGIATAALALALDLVRATEVEMVVGNALVANPASAGVMRAAGMQLLDARGEWLTFCWDNPGPARAGSGSITDR